MSLSAALCHWVVGCHGLHVRDTVCDTVLPYGTQYDIKTCIVSNMFTLARVQGFYLTSC